MSRDGDTPATPDNSGVIDLTDDVDYNEADKDASRDDASQGRTGLELPLLAPISAAFDRDTSSKQRPFEIRLCARLPPPRVIPLARGGPGSKPDGMILLWPQWLSNSCASTLSALLVQGHEHQVQQRRIRETAAAAGTSAVNERSASNLTEPAFQFEFEQRPVVMWGKEVMQPRLVAFTNKRNQPIIYTGRSVPSQPWPALFDDIASAIRHTAAATLGLSADRLKPALSTLSGEMLQTLQGASPVALDPQCTSMVLPIEERFAFDSAHINWYRNGDDYIGKHTDEDLQLWGPQPVIASLTLGATRDFIVTSRKGALPPNTPPQRIEVALPPGSLLLMTGGMQEFWNHEVPKRKGVPNSRFNITFRRMVSAKQA
ncbi:alkylated DNA repair protein [Capsaspora owczarzaki ATCC 30864]|uniref:Alkylated DNA repair protein n=2 Tax=Capsaspora owczarzaki (strain ATCC 30864) TaxID=595528 RepID=A0A0D2X036_CAPO3|nr:alkylated DNA repair protein [Capsaspora owczarzaki ATCC 30864]